MIGHLAGKELWWGQAEGVRSERESNEGTVGIRLTNIRLKKVSTHAGDIANVVSHVVRDDGGVVRIVLVDVLLDLANEIRSDVGGLGVDATRDASEEGNGGGAEAEACQALHDLGLAVEQRREDGVARGHAREAEANHFRKVLGDEGAAAIFGPELDA